MKPETIVALVSACLAAIIAVTVPWMSFRLALRQDHTRWLREQRAQAYVDLLMEAYAEQQWLEYESASKASREHYAPYFKDLRVPPMERARLGVRASIFGSRSVNRLFNLIGAEAFWSMPSGQMDEGRLTVDDQVIPQGW